MKIYGPDDYVARINNGLTQLEKIDTKIECYPGGVLFPDFMREEYGAYDAELKPIASAVSYSGDKSYQRHINAPSPRKIVPSDDDAVYCGSGMFNHFGHFLVESTNRLYPFLDKKYAHCKFVFVPAKKSHKIPKYAYEMLGLLGIKPENIILLQKPTRFRRLYIPHQAFNLYRNTSDAQRDTWAQIAKNAHIRTHYKKIYMSRAAMGDRKTYGEEQIQRIFQKNGYKIIYPEKLPLNDQIALVHNCTHLAGCAGTALHMAAFMKPGGRVIQIKRNTRIGIADRDDNVIAQEMVNRTVGADMTLIWGSIETRPTDHWSEMPQLIGGTKYMTQFFDDEPMKYSSRDLQPTPAQMREYNAAWAEYERTHRAHWYHPVGKTMARIVCMFVPGRHRRTVVRHGIEHMFGIRH